MAKSSVIAREKKRERTVQKYADKRAKLKAILKDVNATDRRKTLRCITIKK